MKKLIAAVALIAALAAAALAGPSVGASSTRTVRIVDNRFAPKTLTVRKGTRVRFLWRGQQPHNVTVVRGPVRFRSSTKTSGRYTKRLTHRGTYRIVCTIHAPDMRMTLRVK